MRLDTQGRRQENRRTDDTKDSDSFNLQFFDHKWHDDESSSRADSANEPSYSNIDGTSKAEIESLVQKPLDQQKSSESRLHTLKTDQKARLATLKGMLEVSTARQENAARKRRPTLAAGVNVGIIAGEHRGQNGTILDADYIASRVLVSLADQSAPMWIAFKHVGPCHG